MKGKDLLQYEADNIGYQLEQVFANLPPNLRDAKLVKATMSPNETLEHLCECYQAAIEDSEGKAHDWAAGFKLETLDWDERLETWRSMRSRALQAVLADDDAKLKACSSYITSHDAYHVGQLCMLRINRESDWDPYSIYRQEAEHSA